MSFSVIAIITLVVLLTISLWVVFRLLKVLGMYENFIKDVYEIHREAYDRLIRADAEGVFESDGDVNSLGWTFDTIFNVMVAVRDRFMDNMPKINYETKQKRNQSRRSYVKARRAMFVWEQRQTESGDDGADDGTFGDAPTDSQAQG